MDRRRPATTWPVAAVLLALLFSGLATSRTPQPLGSAPHAALAAGQTVVHEVVHWTGNHPLRGKVVAVLATTGSGLAPAPAAALTGAFALLLIGATARRVRPRRVGRMHAGRGPPPVLS